MECSICFQKFSAGERRPKSLPCGHSFCLTCVKQLPNKECPMDRKRFKAAAEKLPDNFMLIQLKQEKDATSAPTLPASPAGASTTPRVWCRSCNSEFTESCTDEHPASLCSLKKAREDRTAPRLAALQSCEEALRGLRAQLDAAADGLDAELAASRGRLVDELDALDRERQRLQAAVEAGEAAVEEASEAAGLHGLARDAARLLPALADSASELGVSLKGPGGAWTASIRPEQRPAARLLLCQLACAGELRREGADDQPDGEAAAADGSRWQERSNAVELDGKAMLLKMRRGRRVVRGADWPAGSAVDGQPPSPGTVVKVNGTKITVDWNCGNKATHAMGLKRQGKTVYELKLLPRTVYVVSAGIKTDSAAFLDLRQTSCSLDVGKKLDILSTETLDEVRALVNLHCDVSPAWSKKVLRKVALQLEGLRLLQPDVDHLRTVVGMPELKMLGMSPVGTDTMQMALSMPGLTRVEAHCPFEAPLGTLRIPDQPKLQCLFLGIHPLSVALAIVRANARTLLKLWLVASTRDPYGCPDLAAELRRCGLKKLRNFRLIRETEMHFCQHDNHSCKEQKLQLFDMFLATGLEVKVTCSRCD